MSISKNIYIIYDTEINLNCKKENPSKYYIYNSSFNVNNDKMTKIRSLYDILFFLLYWIYGILSIDTNNVHWFLWL